jgi:probable HAF family extracellular repeat protein
MQILSHYRSRGALCKILAVLQIKKARKGIRMNARNKFVICFLLVLFVPCFAAAQTYTVTDLGVLPGDSSSLAYFVNSSGQITGCSDNSTSQSTLCQGDSPSDAFLWSSSSSSMVGLGNLPGFDASVGITVNDSGQVIGFSENVQTGTYYGFVWTQSGGMVELSPLPGGTTSLAAANNNNGVIVGYSSVSNGDVHTVVWTSSGATYQIKDLGILPGAPYTYAYDINESLQVVGEAYNPSGTRYTAVLWSTATGWKNLGALGVGQNSIADWINDRGVAVGASTTAQNPNGVAVYWDTSEKIHNLGTLPGGTQSYAGGMNNLGQIVGESTVPGGALHACIWQTGGLQDLNNLIPANSGWVLNHASSINKAGQISGFGTINGATHGFLLTP